jgi:hypothetical protein
MAVALGDSLGAQQRHGITFLPRVPPAVAAR